MDLENTEIGKNSETNQSSSPQISHLALDIGGTLVKLVYFSRNGELSGDDEVENSSKDDGRSHSILEGRLHFAKFETSKIDECVAFINSKQLDDLLLWSGKGKMTLRYQTNHGSLTNPLCYSIDKINLGSQHPKDLDNDKIVVKATGGGAYKFADLFREKLRFCLDKEDEMDCLVAGANFLLKAVHQEAFTYMGGQKEFVQIKENDLYPYLLVNIGSGVSMIKVDGNGKFDRVSGTSLGGGTFLGLGRLLTKCNSFVELLELSHRGNNRVIDMLVGDIFGGTDYSKVGLSSTAIASSFGKAISENKKLEEYKPEDLSRSLLRLISNNIGQIAYLNALRFGLKRIFFGGFFICGHAYTMDTISVAVHFWSKGEAKAMFLRHEGFLGALGALVSYKKQGLDNFIQLKKQDPNRLTIAGNKLNGTALGAEATEYESIDCSVYVD